MGVPYRLQGVVLSWIMEQSTTVVTLYFRLMCAFYPNWNKKQYQEAAVTRLEAKSTRRPAVALWEGGYVPSASARGSGWLWGPLPLPMTRLCPPGLSGSGWACCWSTGTPGAMACPLCPYCPASACGLPSWSCPYFHPGKARCDF